MPARPCHANDRLSRRKPGVAIWNPSGRARARRLTAGKIVRLGKPNAVPMSNWLPVTLAPPARGTARIFTNDAVISPGFGCRPRYRWPRGGSMQKFILRCGPTRLKTNASLSNPYFSSDCEEGRSLRNEIVDSRSRCDRRRTAAGPAACRSRHRRPAPVRPQQRARDHRQCDT
jgi:hypothetical protein